MKKIYIALFEINIENLKNLKISYLLEKALVFSIICNKCRNEHKKILKGQESIEILKN